uniref:Nuclear transport factor 2 n=1 Tax=Equus asinus TaxID=9793 RepID=A0A9L0IP61_EQUAS
MGDKPIWEQIGSSFIQHYYQLFDNDRTQLGAIYIDASCLTWEGQQFQGKAAIVEKLSVSKSQGRAAGSSFPILLVTAHCPLFLLQSLPFQKIQHSITAQDHQPTPDSCIISMVVGQLKADEDPIMGFHQMFLLKNINDAWVCTNDMFRLALHNFG